MMDYAQTNSEDEEFEQSKGLNKENPSNLISGTNNPEITPE
jgi:hypothetical protein